MQRAREEPAFVAAWEDRFRTDPEVLIAQGFRVRGVGFRFEGSRYLALVFREKGLRS